MVNYSSKYIANFATIATPLRELTKAGVVFNWEKSHQTAFEQLKSALTTPPAMAYFDAAKETVLTVDASPVGLSGILSQKAPSDSEGKIIAYASRALSDVERRYSQTEKEALSIVWAVEHFHLYLYGHSFTLETDHKPLEIIYGSAKSKPCARIERWVLRLQPYDFNVKYKPGPTNHADFLSRHPATNNTGKQGKMADEYVNFILQHAIPKSMTLDEIREATDNDRVLKALRAAIRLNRWDTDTVKSFLSVKDELSIGTSNIILRGSRIVIPASLQKKAVDLAHACHQGLEKTKALLREKIWFLELVHLSRRSLQNVYLVKLYSRYPEVEIVKSTKCSAVIPKLDKIFAAHGIPFELTSDNGPPFNGDDFARYLKLLGIKFKPSTPKWPQGSAEVERFMQPLNKALTTAIAEGKKWQQELSRFLLQYRITPHSTTKEKKHKLMTRFSKTPYHVVERKGTTVIAENNENHRITRNVSHFKKIPDVVGLESSEDEHDAEQNVALQKRPEQVENYRRRSQRTRSVPVRFGHGLSY
eukprot:gene14704-biopygen11798